MLPPSASLNQVRQSFDRQLAASKAPKDNSGYSEEEKFWWTWICSSVGMTMCK